MYQDLLNGRQKLAVIGLGYVGLPIALEFARRVPVIGFDISEQRVELMSRGIDPSKEIDPEAFLECNIQFTCTEADLKAAGFYIVAVPTPVDECNIPDLRLLRMAAATIGRNIKKGNIVVFESTVYPGCTEEVCQPIIEEISGLRCGPDFKLGYSPERINPGDKKHTLTSITKVVSGSDADALTIISQVYALVVEAGIYKAGSIKVAEAAKIIENTQRDLNIALMNELSLIFDRMNINTYEVLEAAGTKWNFLKFSPGLVGGHCIGVDPFYLTYKASKLGYNSKVILAGRDTNDHMATHLARKIIQHIIRNVADVKDAKVLVMGATFKENIADIRNSKVADLVRELQAYSLQVDVVDPYACSASLQHEYGFHLVPAPAGQYDAVVISVPHDRYYMLDDAYFAGITNTKALIADVKGIYRGKIKSRSYWSF